MNTDPTTTRRPRIQLRKGWFFQYFPLVFSVYYFIPALIIPITGLRLVLVTFYFLLFIAFYIFAIEQPKKLWPAIAMITLGAIASYSTPGAQNFLIYASFFIGFSLPILYMVPMLVAIIALAFALEHFFHYEFTYYTLLVLIGAPALGLWGVIIRLHMQAELREHKSNEEISQLAKTVERERIARDLHDVIGHTLSTITLKAELAHKLLTRQETEKSQRELEQLLSISREGLKQVRETISGVNRATLASTTIQLTEKLRQRGLETTVEGSVPTLDGESERALVLILTELTTNILRHSQASLCTLSFSEKPDQVVVQLCDNGQVEGFQPGNGLGGIAHRMESLGGTMQVDTQEQFCVTLTLPREPTP